MYDKYYYHENNIGLNRRRYCKDHVELISLNNIKRSMQQEADNRLLGDHYDNIMFRSSELNIRGEINRLYGGSDDGHLYYFNTKLAMLNNDIKSLPLKCEDYHKKLLNYKMECHGCNKKQPARYNIYGYCKNCRQCPDCKDLLIVTRELCSYEDDVCKETWHCDTCERDLYHYKKHCDAYISDYYYPSLTEEDYFDICEDITKDITKDITEDITKNITKDITEDITKDITKDIPENNNNTPENNNEDIPENNNEEWIHTEEWI